MDVAIMVNKKILLSVLECIPVSSRVMSIIASPKNIKIYYTGITRYMHPLVPIPRR